MHDVYPGVRIILPSLEERIAQAHIVARTIAAGTKRGARWTAREILSARDQLAHVRESADRGARVRAAAAELILSIRLEEIRRDWAEWYTDISTPRGRALWARLTRPA